MPLTPMPDKLMDKMTNEESDQMVDAIKERMKAFVPIDANWIIILDSPKRSNFVSCLEHEDILNVLDRVAGFIVKERKALRKKRRESE